MDYKENIAILIVTHNHGDYIGNLLDSLQRFGYQNVYICDAASRDGTAALLRKSVYKDNLLLKSELEGFSKNNNDLIRKFHLEADYFLLLNPDLYFTEDFIPKLYDVMQKDATIGITAPLTYYPDGRLQVTWKKFPNILHVAAKRLGLRKATSETQMKSGVIDWCLGACMLISKKLLKANGTLLDERYRLYCEDVDICFEAKQKKLKVVGVSEGFAYHHLNELSAKKIFSKYNIWNISSIMKFMLKWNFRYFAK